MDSYWRLKNLVNDLPVSTSLSRQGSIYSWTVDQFQTSLGLDCGSMNMDELVKHISSAEETQEGSQRQGSTTLPPTLSKQNVGEVWKSITEEKHTNNNGGVTNITHLQGQQTLGEITLEEFFIRAGARGGNTNGGSIHDSSSSISGNPHTSLGVQIQPKAMVSDFMNNMVPRSHDSYLHQNVNGSMSTYQPQQSIMSMPNGYSYGKQIRFSNGSLGSGNQSLQDTKRSLVPSVATIPSEAITCSPVTPFPTLNGKQKINGESSLLSPSPYISNGSTSTRGGKINSEITAEKQFVDKKLRRKIKNRESAARSRARKQAQTMEVEVELENLKKDYEELLKQHVELRKRQMEPGMISLHERPERKLRRTKSDIK
ncbi:abscisic acid responsive elements-binding factor-like protein [Arabidopsis thaliana]|uniref:ABSCISIC ACID-INSENSITIVE 5-like protein 8 n=1 Tax=Arabidopsis thaliana TaxID=3702 RepID=AI5L8_ARATH|nr:Basic-leucine zipper (bZIP) transcription factor family protein [Arabidopsis thaliana]Q9FMM7.1 RecName: Full=ABSCISIC ACID-INSENSITIVE 5-like protein 8; AltName: Full=bZIP transcription factor 15; Short=AtbZIP15 [Arabidopsis thaliana]AED94886.1 Basic-leucine zipper (bZIP) transcription factor family protein [Arabidopsis thaliana]BAB09193.1 abscisic acid responsive elements-binding factor-like protein [Arabidopsis thaliana]CAD11866.1 basic leucine zipper transcription factor [Arabidopsis thal|eukprot:NP_199105.1 Basic-leucine zipper (bZIP) transcription factor family protein [Arabidopsis thaliana]